MERVTVTRSRIIQLIFVVLLCFFAFRLYDLQVIETGGVIDNTTTYTTWTRVKAARGEILDRNGNEGYADAYHHQMLECHACESCVLQELHKAVYDCIHGIIRLL